MNRTVFFLPIVEGEADEALCRRLSSFLQSKDLFTPMAINDLVAVKTHFGEEGSNGYVRPLFLKMIGEWIKSKQALPFLTETSTLYTGMRNNAIKHITLAHKHGFGFGQVEMPIIMADGLIGGEETEVTIPGRIYQKVKIAALLSRIHSLILVSHFTGHIAAGFGAALKNLGMGLSSRKGKLNQHSTAKPSVKRKKCTGCESCLPWCPQQAISISEGTARIDTERCIGCGECLTVCRFDAIGYNWGETYEQLQKKVVEHAWGVVTAVSGRILCINFLTRITKDCDCMTTFQPVLPDIGIVIGTDPVAVDAASLDLAEQAGNRPFSGIAYDIPYRVQIEYARQIGFGVTDYRLITVTGD